MAKSTDFTDISSEHLESIQNDLLMRDGHRDMRPSTSPGASALHAQTSSQMTELASLRDFNAQLLARIGEFRKRNLELSASENSLQIAFAAQAKQLIERDLIQAEITSEANVLRAALQEQREATEQLKNDLSRKLAKISDESWAKSIELESLVEVTTQQKSEILKLQINSRRDLEESQNSLQSEIENLKAETESLTAKNHEQSLERAELAAGLAEQMNRENQQAEQLGEANQLLSALETELRSIKTELEFVRQCSQSELTEAHAKLKKETDEFNHRERQLIAAFENLRTEYSSIDQCYRQATESVTQLRSELHLTEQRSQAALVDLQLKLQSDFQNQFEAVASENRELHELLKVRDTRHDVERTKLQTWREQLSYLEQHLRQFSDSMKKDKVEILRYAKQILQDLELSRTHPFKEYLDIAELEFSHLQGQLNQMSALSPVRTKTELRLSQAKEHRDTLHTMLAQVEREFDERAKVIGTIVRSLQQSTLDT
jgi:chromosome segregation ATPase